MPNIYCENLTWVRTSELMGYQIRDNGIYINHSQSLFAAFNHLTWSPIYQQFFSHALNLVQTNPTITTI